MQKFLLIFFCFYTSFILLFRKFTCTTLLLDFRDLKYKGSILKIYLKYTFHTLFSVSDRLIERTSSMLDDIESKTA